MTRNGHEKKPATKAASDWPIFDPNREPADVSIPPAPPWRKFVKREKSLGAYYVPDATQTDVINASILLRRPLLVSGDPGVGKSTLAEAIAYRLNLGEVLRWHITSKSTLKEGLYEYDAIGRFQDKGDIIKYMSLGPLGTAFAAKNGRPRVLLVDELDKADIDLPNDLLNLLEDGLFEIPELSRLTTETKSTFHIRVHRKRSDADKEATIGSSDGFFRCQAETYPIVIFTTNGEREFSPAFHRRCIRLEIGKPGRKTLEDIVQAQLGDEKLEKSRTIIQDFIDRRDRQDDVLANDQLFNAITVVLNLPSKTSDDSKKALLDSLLRSLTK